MANYSEGMPKGKCIMDMYNTALGADCHCMGMVRSNVHEKKN